jgi:uncharacterized protein (TIGR02145 family)
MNVAIYRVVPAIFFGLVIMIILFLEKDYLSKYTESPIEVLSQSSHPRGKDLYEFVISSPENKLWYQQNKDNIRLVENGIEIQGLTFSLEDEKAPDNGNNIWNQDGNTYFTFDAAQRHAAEQGRRVPTDTEWQKLDDFLPKGQAAKFFLDVLKVPLGGYRTTDGSAIYNRGYNAYLWSSSPYDAITLYRRYTNYGNSSVFRSHYNKSFGFTVRCVKD